MFGPLLGIGISNLVGVGAYLGLSQLLSANGENFAIVMTTFVAMTVVLLATLMHKKQKREMGDYSLLSALVFIISILIAIQSSLVARRLHLEFNFEIFLNVAVLMASLSLMSFMYPPQLFRNNHK